jgi:glucose/arabinose dehydrogenase
MKYLLIFLVAIFFPIVACSPAALSPTPTPSISPVAATATPSVEATSTLGTLEPSVTPPPGATATLSPVTPAATPSMEATLTNTPAAFSPQVEVVATGLQVPWAMAFAPDGRLFFTERAGRIRVIRDGQLDPAPVAEVNVRATGEGGLMGLALDPQFDQNGYMYVMYTYDGSAGPLNRISRLTLQGEQAGNELVLVDDIPGGQNHDGGRLEFGPDGKLYATTGETFERDLAQQMDSLAGKILRMNSDGSVPSDNPFPDSLIYTLGHRNPQGLAWTESGQLYSTEHGPSGEMGLRSRDELNRIEVGKNYGWPVVTTETDDPRFVPAVLNSGANNTWAPAGLATYKGTRLGPWRGNLFFGALRGRHLHRVVLAPDGSVESDEELYAGQYGRIRAVVEGPDGYLYFSTSNRDGRGSPASNDDRILRIVPGL